MEELKMIVEIISKVSDNAQTVLIIYFVKEFLTNLLTAGFFIILIISLIRFFTKVIGLNSKLGKIRNILGISLSTDTDLNSVIFTEIIIEIQRLKMIESKHLFDGE